MTTAPKRKIRQAINNSVAKLQKRPKVQYKNSEIYKKGEIQK